MDDTLYRLALIYATIAMCALIRTYFDRPQVGPWAALFWAVVNPWWIFKDLDNHDKG